MMGEICESHKREAVKVIQELSQMPTAEWGAYYDHGMLFEGYEVTGEDAALAELMEAWERIEDAVSEGDVSREDGMAAQAEAADQLQRVADMLRTVPLSEWRTGCYLSAVGCGNAKNATP